MWSWEPVRIRLQKLSQHWQTEKYVLQLHLITNTGGCLGVVLEKLKLSLVDVSIKTTVHAESTVTWLNTSGFFFGCSDAEKLHQRRITKGRSGDFFECTSEYLSGASYCFVLFARKDERP